MRKSIEQHEGKKYLRTITPAGNTSQSAIEIDVYSVLEAFQVTCPATAHCIKKLLAAGQRGKGTRKDDLVGAMAALNRAIDLEERTHNIERVVVDKKPPDVIDLTRLEGTTNIALPKELELEFEGKMEIGMEFQVVELGNRITLKHKPT